MSENDEMKDQIATLREEVRRLNVRLNVALELLGECRFAGFPENAGLVNVRLEEAERIGSAQSSADLPGEDTASHAAMVESPSLRTPEQPFQAPFVPAEAPLAQQTHTYDLQTDKERRMDKALDVLGSLGKLK